MYVCLCNLNEMEKNNQPYKRELQQTADGSSTLFIPSMNEHYHSVNGAVQESIHVFITAGMRQLSLPKIEVIEIGFGTGLNAFLTLLEAEKENITVTYHTFELYPLSKEITDQLNYGQICPEYANDFSLLHSAPWNEEVGINDHFILHKIEGDANQLPMPQAVDLIYFDAFAPDKQPEMWNQDLFDRLYGALNPGGILTTYCAKGAVRRSLQASGFQMERIPGPPGKREMLRGRK